MNETPLTDAAKLTGRAMGAKRLRPLIELVRRARRETGQNRNVPIMSFITISLCMMFLFVMAGCSSDGQGTGDSSGEGNNGAGDSLVQETPVTDAAALTGRWEYLFPASASKDNSDWFFVLEFSKDGKFSAFYAPKDAGAIDGVFGDFTVSNGQISYDGTISGMEPDSFKENVSETFLASLTKDGKLIIRKDNENDENDLLKNFIFADVEYTKVQDEPVSISSNIGAGMNGDSGSAEEGNRDIESNDNSGETGVTLGDINVLEGVNVMDLFSKNLGEVINILGPDHSKPYFYQGCVSCIGYNDTCRISYGELVEEPQLELDARINTITIYKKVDVYKGISVGKTLDEMNKNPDLKNQLQSSLTDEGTDGDGAYVADVSYKYEGASYQTYVLFDKNLICTSVFIKHSYI